jgi:RNA polymerase sigma-70 factor (ECF subfamily)
MFLPGADGMAALEMEQAVTGRLELIETDWTLVFEPAHVVLRYAPAVQSYLNTLLRNRHDAEEVAQEFFLWVTQHGLPRVRQDRGRFRDYLKKVVRNKALNFLRDAHRPSADANLLNVPAPEDTSEIPEQEWLLHWRGCLLKRAWQRLEDHQERSPKSRYFTVLNLCATHPGEDSRQLAARAGALDGAAISPDAFRKQVSRARRLFAELLVHEVAQTLERPEPVDVEDELVDLGLMTYVREYLPIRRRNLKN